MSRKCIDTLILSELSIDFPSAANYTYLVPFNLNLPFAFRSLVAQKSRSAKTKFSSGEGKVAKMTTLHEDLECVVRKRIWTWRLLRPRRTFLNVLPGRTWEACCFSRLHAFSRTDGPGCRLVRYEQSSLACFDISFAVRKKMRSLTGESSYGFNSGIYPSL